jgi:hypothetical protein
MGNNSYIQNKYVSTAVLKCATCLEVVAKHTNFIVVRYQYGTVLPKLWPTLFLTPSIVESAYKCVSGICCCYLQGGSEWCVLWSGYVGHAYSQLNAHNLQTLKMEAVYSSEMLVSVYGTTGCHSLEDNNMKIDRCGEQKTCN